MLNITRKERKSISDMEAVPAPWEGCGKTVSRGKSPGQVLHNAGLDWKVEKFPQFFEIRGKKYPSGSYALVRSSDHKKLTEISEDWEPVQNSEAFQFFSDYCKAGGMEIAAAGELRGGSMVWALADMKDGFEFFGGDRINGYMLFSNPHQYGWSIDIRFSPIRMVSMTTLMLSLTHKEDQMVRLNHRRKFNTSSVEELMGIAHGKLETYRERASFLGSKKATREKVEQYLRMVFPVTGNKRAAPDGSRSAQKALSILDTQPGAEFAPGTWWQAFNAATYSMDHLVGHTAETRMNSSWYGINRKRKLFALEKAIELAKKS